MGISSKGFGQTASLKGLKTKPPAAMAKKYGGTELDYVKGSAIDLNPNVSATTDLTGAQLAYDGSGTFTRTAYSFKLDNMQQIDGVYLNTKLQGGKHYFEIKNTLYNAGLPNTDNSDTCSQLLTFGLTSSDPVENTGVSNYDSYGYRTGDFGFYLQPTNTYGGYLTKVEEGTSHYPLQVSLGSVNGWRDGEVAMFAYDGDTGNMWGGVDGVWLEGNPATGETPSFTVPRGKYFAIAAYNYHKTTIVNIEYTINYGQTTYIHTNPFA